ncbi:hypothetical protein CSKR_201938 [Clonorchis sinensis]|uniref:Uncharacterized protein n=1 Tax=Clonorchis sinensis TaxID=79923 RepID=A0A8T1MZA1_CLOSI|nr:hypothetical protein CSKR_201938 [Clonorchis sinensis]
MFQVTNTTTTAHPRHCFPVISVNPVTMWSPQLSILVCACLALYCTGLPTRLSEEDIRLGFPEFLRKYSQSLSKSTRNTALAMARFNTVDAKTFVLEDIKRNCATHFRKVCAGTNCRRTANPVC